MIDQAHPDYADTPASERRPVRAYLPADSRGPLVSVVTPYYNTGPVFWETFRAIQRMTMPYWEWLIVDDASTDTDSLEQLREAERLEPRIRVIQQANGGPAVARNHAVREARGKYLLLLDSDDMIEPTFVEKAMWFLETQPATFSAVNSYNVTFGAKNLLWPHGFDHGRENIRENFSTIQSVVRRADYLQVGGFDESISYEHADWDFWLTLAEHGLWGYTLPEYLTWYRTQSRSLMTEIEGDRDRANRFRLWLAQKHQGLSRRFPQPRPWPAGVIPAPAHFSALPFENPLVKPDEMKRILLIAPWMEVGGADQFNVDVVRELTDAGYECSVVTTMRGHTPWLSRFTALTPDVFCLHTFLNLGDFPRFLSYLIESRQIDAVITSNSEFGYAILPYLRARHPGVALLDYTHMEESQLPDGGYPGKSVAAGDLLDLRMTNTEHLKRWMVERGAPADQVEVRRCAIDVDAWRPDAAAREDARAKWRITNEKPLITFVGRMSAQKRPTVFADVLAEVARRGVDFAAIAVGDGELLRELRRAIGRYGLANRVQAPGALSPAETREILRATDILLLPSEMEGLAFALIEAMSVGAAVVAAQVGGQGELVAPGAGYLIENGPGEVQRYADAVERLATDAALRATVAAEGRREVERQFSVAQLSAGLHASLTRAMGMAKARPAQEVTDALSSSSFLAHAAVSSLASHDRLDARWLASNQQPIRKQLRRLRQTVIPMGSERYAVYSRFRTRLRGG